MPVILLAAPIATLGAVGGVQQSNLTPPRMQPSENGKNGEEQSGNEMGPSENNENPSFLERIMNRILKRQNTTAAQFTMG